MIKKTINIVWCEHFFLFMIYTVYYETSLILFSEFSRTLQSK